MKLSSIVIGLGVSVLVAWALLAAFVIAAKPRAAILQETLRILPDILKLLRRLATDTTLPRGVRVRLVLLFLYLASPIDLIPDFIPVIGFADDAIMILVVLRSVIRNAGIQAVRRHWSGTQEGLAILFRVAGIPQQLPGGSAPTD